MLNITSTILVGDCRGMLHGVSPVQWTKAKQDVTKTSEQSTLGTEYNYLFLLLPHLFWWYWWFWESSYQVVSFIWGFLYLPQSKVSVNFFSATRLHLHMEGGATRLSNQFVVGDPTAGMCCTHLWNIWDDRKWLEWQQTWTDSLKSGVTSKACWLPEDQLKYNVDVVIAEVYCGCEGQLKYTVVKVSLNTLHVVKVSLNT